jgi:hypothetical protein
VYREVNLTVPRQSGKTLLLLCAMVHRAQGFGRRQRILYTAQTRNDARRKWEDEHVEVLRRSPLHPLFTVRKSNGSEAIHWRNGSMHGITSSRRRLATARRSTWASSTRRSRRRTPGWSRACARR